MPKRKTSSPPPALRRDQALGVADRKREAVEVPEWDATVHLSEMSLTLGQEYVALIGASEGDETGLVTALLVRTIVDENGERLFTDDDGEALAGMSLKVLKRLFAIAGRLNGVTDEGLAQLEGN